MIMIEFVTKTSYSWEPRLRLCVGVWLASSGDLPAFTEEAQMLMTFLWEFAAGWYMSGQFTHLL